MPKQSSKETKDRSPKKLDTTIIVALIALVGTLVTALFSSPVIVPGFKGRRPLLQLKQIQRLPHLLIRAGQ
jgi:hypothetical protein